MGWADSLLLTSTTLCEIHKQNDNRSYFEKWWGGDPLFLSVATVQIHNYITLRGCILKMRLSRSAWFSFLPRVIWFTCYKCDKAFSCSGTLKEHERLHVPVPNVTSHLQIVVIWKSWKDLHRREVICLFEMWQDIQLEWHFERAWKTLLACSKCDPSFTDR